jgi:hypothetical protein
MRKTIRLDENLLREAKQLAAESGTTLSEFIQEALRERIARAKAGTRARPAVRLHAVGTGGVRRGVDLDDTASLIERMQRRR